MLHQTEQRITKAVKQSGHARNLHPPQTLRSLRKFWGAISLLSLIPLMFVWFWRGVATPPTDSSLSLVPGKITIATELQVTDSADNNPVTFHLTESMSSSPREVYTFEIRKSVTENAHATLWHLQFDGSARGDTYRVTVDRGWGEGMTCDGEDDLPQIAIVTQSDLSGKISAFSAQGENMATHLRYDLDVLEKDVDAILVVFEDCQGQSDLNLSRPADAGIVKPIISIEVDPAMDNSISSGPYHQISVPQIRTLNTNSFLMISEPWLNEGQATQMHPVVNLDSRLRIQLEDRLGGASLVGTTTWEATIGDADGSFLENSDVQVIYLDPFEAANHERWNNVWLFLASALFGIGSGLLIDNSAWPGKSLKRWWPVIFPIIIIVTAICISQA